MVGASLRKSRRKAPSCRLEIMLIGASLRFLGESGEVQGKCQFVGFLPESSIVKTENWANLRNGYGISF
jgi:hypothetical protein